MAAVKQRVHSFVMRKSKTPPRFVDKRDDEEHLSVCLSPQHSSSSPSSSSSSSSISPSSSSPSSSSSSSTITETRKHFIFMAKLAALAHRDEEVLEAMKPIAQLGVELTIEEKNLLSVSFKRVIDTKRTSWRVIITNEKKQKKQRSPTVPKIQNHRHNIEQEIKTLCFDFSSLLENYLLPSTTSPESQIFYLKIRGDVHRYLAEIAPTKCPLLFPPSSLISSMISYQEASFLSKKYLGPTHPVRLAVSLCFSLFVDEMLGDREGAVGFARGVLGEALENIDEVQVEEFQCTMRAIQMLRKRVEEWERRLNR